MNWRWSAARRLLAFVLVTVVGLGLVSCGDRPSRSASRLSSSDVSLAGKISETSPPEVIQSLRQTLEVYQPQVKILSPRPDEVLKDDRVSIRFQVQDLPLFKNQDLGLGPHLHVILDNEPYLAVYDSSQPLVLELSPGTHTLKAFASRPWHESFKNEGAYAQTTFHVFTKTPENQPISTQPLLTYSRPQGSYGAEPIMLDFYLTNTPLHLVAQERSNDDILDWKIRCTINGQSFVFEDWQPLYLKGLKPGKNWVQLELLDEKGEAIANPFNNTARLITYEPNGSDTLAKLVRGELSAAELRGIVDLNYKPELPEPEPTPTLSPLPLPESAPELTPIPVPSTLPASEVPSSEVPSASGVEVPVTPLEEQSPDAEMPDLEELETPTSETEPSQPTLPEPALPLPSQSAKLKGFFNRFRRPVASPTLPSPATLPEVLDSPTLDSVESELEADESQATESEDLKSEDLESEKGKLEAIEPEITKFEAVEPEVIEPEERKPLVEPPEVELVPELSPQFQPDRFKGFFNRFRRRIPNPPPPPEMPLKGSGTPTPDPTAPEVFEAAPILPSEPELPLPNASTERP